MSEDSVRAVLPPAWPLLYGDLKPVKVERLNEDTQSRHVFLPLFCGDQDRGYNEVILPSLLYKVK